jgi:hypothetical protein
MHFIYLFFRISGAHYNGVSVNNSKVQISSSLIFSNREDGVHVFGADSAAVLENSRIFSNSSFGLHTHTRAALKARFSFVQNNGQSAVCCTGEGSSADVAACVLAANGWQALAAWGGGRIFAEWSNVAGNEGGGVRVDGQSVVELDEESRATIEGEGVGFVGSRAGGRAGGGGVADWTLELGFQIEDWLRFVGAEGVAGAIKGVGIRSVEEGVSLSKNSALKDVLVRADREAAGNFIFAANFLAERLEGGGVPLEPREQSVK